MTSAITSETTARRDPFAIAGYILLSLGAVVSLIEPGLGFIPVALVFGWAQIGGV
jgi:hypothetical protein